MSDAKRTPGPWWYDSYNTIFAGTAQNRNLLKVCSIPDESETDDGKHFTRDEWYAQSAANARLIAAAPELLEAGHEFCRVIAFEPEVTLKEAINRAYERMKAAIAKAEAE